MQFCEFGMVGKNIFVLDLYEFGITNYLKQGVHFVAIICSVACLAVYRKLGVLIYSNLNCGLKMRLDNMSMMVLKHLLQIGLLHLLGVKIT